MRCALVLPFLAAACAASPSPSAPPATIGNAPTGSLPISVQPGPDGMRVTAGGEPFCVLRTDGPRPWLQPVVGPGGVLLTRGFPHAARDGEAHDHPHHTSLWLAHGDVGGVDFWHQGGRIEVEHWLALESGETRGAVAARLAWRGSDGELVATEVRRLVFAAAPSRRTVDVHTRIEAPADRDLVFGDTKEGTFALRLAAPLRLEGAVARGAMRNAAGDRDGDCWGRRAAWISAWGPIEDEGDGEGDVYGVAILDHPDNPRHPTWWHARPYGLVAANPFGRHDFEGAEPGAGDLVVPAGGTLELSWRVVLHAGELSPAQLDRELAAFASAEPSPVSRGPDQR